MPELRKDPIIGRWVIIAKERGKRPTDFVIEKEQTKGGFCPLCPGHENTTPAEVLAFGRNSYMPNAPGWTLRVVPNKFPAMIIEGELNKRGEGIFDKMNGIGAHEVIVETPDHNETMPEMAPEQLIQVFQAYNERIKDLSGDKRIRYIMVFKNSGRASGASLEHSHSQLIALPVVPYLIQDEINFSLTYFKYKDRCVFCDIIHQELSQGIRLVTENDEFLAICPFAPRAPFEMWVLPKRHQSSYTYIDDKQLHALTSIMLDILKKLHEAIPNVPYNYMLHTAPVREDPLEHYHWHIEIMPKLTMVAGFEWGTGFYINPTPPEDSASFLRP